MSCIIFEVLLLITMVILSVVLLFIMLVVSVIVVGLVMLVVVCYGDCGYCNYPDCGSDWCDCLELCLCLLLSLAIAHFLELAVVSHR